MPSALIFSVPGFSVGLVIIALSGILVVGWRHTNGPIARRIMLCLAILLFFPVGLIITFIGLQYNLWMPGLYIAMRLIPNETVWVASGRFALSSLVNSTCLD